MVSNSKGADVDVEKVIVPLVGSGRAAHVIAAVEKQVCMDFSFLSDHNCNVITL